MVSRKGKNISAGGGGECCENGRRADGQISEMRRKRIKKGKSTRPERSRRKAPGSGVVTEAAVDSQVVAADRMALRVMICHGSRKPEEAAESLDRNQAGGHVAHGHQDGSGGIFGPYRSIRAERGTDVHMRRLEWS